MQRKGKLYFLLNGQVFQWKGNFFFGVNKGDKDKVFPYDRSLLMEGRIILIKLELRRKGVTLWEENIKHGVTKAF